MVPVWSERLLKGLLGPNRSFSTDLLQTQMVTGRRKKKTIYRFDLMYSIRKVLLKTVNLYCAPRERAFTFEPYSWLENI